MSIWLKYKKIIVVSFISIILISIILITLSGYLQKTIKKTSNQNNLPANKITNNFPLEKNYWDLYNFQCEFQEFIYKDKSIQNINKTIEVGFTCKYKDNNNQTHSIKLPFVTKNNSNGQRLLLSRFLESDLPQWSDKDFIISSETQYYNVHGRDLDLYDDPKIKNYTFDRNVKKPEITKGDIFVVQIASEDSEVFTNPKFKELRNASFFFKDLHKNVYTYKNINQFIESGNIDNLLIDDGWFIPTWVDFIEDRDPQ